MFTGTADFRPHRECEYDAQGNTLQSHVKIFQGPVLSNCIVYFTNTKRSQARLIFPLWWLCLFILHTLLASFLSWSKNRQTFHVHLHSCDIS